MCYHFNCEIFMRPDHFFVPQFRFEIIKRVHLSLTMFSVENNTLTPTMKVRRKDAYNLYKTELDALYALGEPSSKL